MNAKKIVIGIIMAVLVCLCVIGNIYLLTTEATTVRSNFAASTIMPKIGTGFNLVALVCVCIYALTGFKKKASLFYKGFFLFYAVHLLTGIYGTVVDFDNAAPAGALALGLAINFANMMLLFCAGKLREEEVRVGRRGQYRYLDRTPAFRVPL